VTFGGGGVFRWESLAGPAVRDGAYYGLSPSDSLDHTQNFIDAFTDSAANGTILRLPSGTFYYSGLIDNADVGLIGAGGGLTKVLCTTSNGGNSRFDFSHKNGLYIWGVEFGTTSASILLNNATETAAILRLTGCNNFRIEACRWDRCWGTAILVRNCQDGIILGNYAKNLGKDGFHITGSSKRITRAFNTIVNGGDDQFPIVGYVTDGVRPESIYDIGNRTYGARFGRGFAYVGSKYCRNIGCSVHPLPDDGERTDLINATYTGVSSGLYIASESSFNSYGNEDLMVRDFTVEQGGNVAGRYAVQIAGRGSQPCKNIDIEATIRDSCSHAFNIDGGTVGTGLVNLRFRGNIIDTTNPAGLRGLTPGAGSGHGIQITKTNGFDLDFYAEKIGACPLVVIDDFCTGVANIKLEVNEASVNAVNDLIQFSPSGGTLNRINVDLRVRYVGHTIDRLIDNVPPGATVRFHSDVQLNNADAIIGLPAVPSPTVTASPYVWDNPYPYPVLVRINGGTITQVRRATTVDVASPNWQVLVAAADGTTNLKTGQYELLAGQSLEVTYSAAPTLSIRGLSN